MKRIDSSESFKGTDSKEQLVRESDITIVRWERDSKETDSTGAHSSSTGRFIHTAIFTVYTTL